MELKVGGPWLRVPGEEGSGSKMADAVFLARGRGLAENTTRERFQGVLSLESTLFSFQV